MLVKIIAISSQKTTPSERLLRGGLCLLALAIAVKPLAQAVGYHLRYATATTAASGGNREELLEPRPAGCECRPRHEADAGSRTPYRMPAGQHDQYNISDRVLQFLQDIIIIEIQLE